MASTLGQRLASDREALFLFAIALILFSDYFFGLSELLPDGVFHLLFGILLLASAVWLFWSQRGDGQ